MKKTVLTLISVLFVSSAYSFEPAKYFKMNCSSCHSIGEGDKIGPDLAGLSKRRKLDWIVKFVGYPEGMINGDEEEAGYEKPDALAKKIFEQYKPTVMTEFPDLDKNKIKALLTYIDSLKKKPTGKILKVK